MTRPALHDDRSVLDARLTTTLAAFVAEGDRITAEAKLHAASIQNEFRVKS